MSSVWSDPVGLPIGDSGAVITVGTFDGVHRGHHDVLARLAALAAETDRPSVVVTFEPHPLEVVRPSAAPPLLTLHDEKLEMFAQSGVSYVAVLPFTPTLASYEAEQFVDAVLRERFRVAELLVGHDHGFGRGRLGDIDVLQALGASRGFGVTVLPPVHAPDGQAISSTAIRTAILEGDLRAAAAGLGRPYSIAGTVIRGDQRGRLLGYPTLNLQPPSTRKLLPPDGVYAVRVQTPQGPFSGMLNLGPRPTFGDASRRIETHVFDAAHDWYGAPIRIDLMARIRDTRSFDGIEALRAQLARDESAARETLQGLATATTSGPLS
ncbi:bifunctional riboflavin kinase/FAD synthetase [Gemmatimonas groenlandica]|uniref:Riboflavin biosynthesis protein n=1 Tax=Gemmatimonas groenlandica TaxID=2732249 RepID=A0A6M4IMY6_9BACT|nr:bifunctional riboflavin kinase/FAD synthetase [Gemmatimonas groenlandica]QJR35139.1 bifunctional riboflavin kinase/FAD synthetase [Gemmatimonas groenlandica]